MRSVLFGFVIKHAYNRQTDIRTDRQTDGQNYDSQDRFSIAASRGKNGKYNITTVITNVISSLCYKLNTSALHSF